MPWIVSGKEQIILWEQAVLSDQTNSFMCRLDTLLSYILLNMILSIEKIDILEVQPIT